MSEDKIITPHNENGQPHGFWEDYWDNGHICYKCYFVNNELVGYDEDYDFHNGLDNKTFWIR